MKFFISITLITLLFANSLCATLDSVSDDDLVQLFKKETFLVVLFSTKNCEVCDKLEGHLFNLEDEIKDNLNAPAAVKAFNSQLVRLYSPTKEPALVFFRHGVPLLYDGPLNDDAIIEKFAGNKEPTVKELSDENFEHLTQASTGSTTGDWLVMFYTQECVDCHRLTAVWEAVGAALKNRVNVARINKETVGAVTGKRFKINKAPEFILVRQGKFYRYEITKFDVQSFVTFAKDWYRNSTPEKITVPTSPFDNIVLIAVDVIQQVLAYTFVLMNKYPKVFLFSFMGLGVFILVAIIFKIVAGKKTSKKEEKKNKKKAK